MKSFRTTRKFMAPPRFTAGEGGLVGHALDVLKDAFMNRLQRGLRARFPFDPSDPSGKRTAPPDALAAMGRDRRVFRGIFETAAEYAARLVTWTDDAQTRGTAFALLKQLHAYTGAAHGVSFRLVDARGNWYSRAADGTETAVLKTGNWNWDGAPLDELGRTRWSRFWVIIYPGTLWTPSTFDWGDAAGPNWGAYAGSYASAQTLGSTATQQQVATLRAIVTDWMGTGKRCVNIILAFDPSSFDPAAPEPDGTWGKSYKYDAGVAVPSRLTTARYLRGTGP